jgi:hypothetical protein
LSVTIPDSVIAPGNTSQEITVEAWIYPRSYKARGIGNADILTLHQAWDSSLGISQDKWLLPEAPVVRSGSHTMVSTSEWLSAVTLNQWQTWKITRTSDGIVSFYVNEVLVKSEGAANNYGRTNAWTFRIGDIDADLDQVRISNIVRADAVSDALLEDAHSIAHYHFDGDFQDSGNQQFHLQVGGNTRHGNNPQWMSKIAGQTAVFENLGDTLTAILPNSVLSPGNTATSLCIEAWILPREYKAYGNDSTSILHLYQHWDSAIGIIQDKWLKPSVPLVMAGSSTVVTNSEWNQQIQIGVWQKIKINRYTDGRVEVHRDGQLISERQAPMQEGRNTDWILQIGNFRGEIDELRISNINR